MRALSRSYVDVETAESLRAERDVALLRAVTLEQQLAVARAELAAARDEKAVLAKESGRLSALLEERTREFEVAQPGPEPAANGEDEGLFFGSWPTESVSEVMFVRSAGLRAIEYSSPEEVVGLQKSYNLAQVALDGGAPETCEGYICCLRTGGELQVFAAVYGRQSGRAGVYRPEVQPAGEEGLAAAVAGAVAFHEQVGLMMEPFDLHPSLKRAALVPGCPVLRAKN